MSNIKNSYDAFCRNMLVKKENAVDFLRNYFPKELIKKIDLRSMAISKDSFIEKELQDYYSDIYIKLNLRRKIFI